MYLLTVSPKLLQLPDNGYHSQCL